MRHAITLLTIALFLPIEQLFAQNSFKEVFIDAEYYLAMNDPVEATPLFAELWEKDSTNHNINYRLGLCYLNIAGQKDRAIKFLEYATQNITHRYREGSYKETKAPEISIYNLGEAYLINNQLEQAICCFQKFKQYLDSDDNRVDFVNQQIEACSNAKQIMQSPLMVNNIDITINQQKNKSYLYPILSGDRKTLVFSAKEKFYDAIYCCRYDGTKWGAPYNATIDLALEGEIYATSLNHDGTQMLIFHNAISTGNIYISNYTDGHWSTAKKIEGSVNSKYWETFASLSNDGKTLVFTSNRKGSLGGLDIYISKKNANGSWSVPKNMGSTINTIYNEESPVLSNDGKTLYFASQGHNTMGGFDIFISKQINDSTWSAPNNIGYPINTTDDELFLFPIDSANALISTIDTKKSPNYEISQISYRTPDPVKHVMLLANINFNDNRVNNFHIVLKDNSGNTISDSTMANGNSTFQKELEPNTYVVEVECEGYKTALSNVFIPSDFAQSTIPVSLTLEPNTQLVAEAQKTKSTVHLKNILFDFDSYTLSTQSAEELNKISELMRENPDIQLEVAGHTDSKGSASYNHRLSRKRAYSVVKHLTATGIDKNRFEVKSMGSIANVAANTQTDGSDNPEGRLYNRCVLLRILNTNANVSIEFEAVPKHLQPMEQMCIIILAQQNSKFTEQQIQEAQDLLNRKITLHSYNDEYFMTTSSYKSKSTAIVDLKKALDSKYPDAYLGNEMELKKLCSHKKFQSK